MMPPAEVPPSELFAKLLELPRPNEVIDFPRNDAQGQPVGRVRIQTLESKEHDDARIRATARLLKGKVAREDLETPAVKQVLADAVAKDIIALSCLSEKNYGTPERPTYSRVFRDATDVDRLGADEIVILFNAYQLVQSKFGPFERNLSAEDLDAWIQRLGEGAAEFPLLHLALPQLVLLAQSLGARLFTLYLTLASLRGTLPTTLESLLPDFFTDTGSAGSPADASDHTTSVPSSAEFSEITLEKAAEMARKMRGE